MPTVFYAMGILLVESLERVKLITFEVYCETLRKKAQQNRLGSICLLDEEVAWGPTIR